MQNSGLSNHDRNAAESQPKKGEVPSSLMFDPNTGKAIVRCTLKGDGTIPGWQLELLGWHLSNEVLSAVWAKTRKILRIYGVDAVALFSFDDANSPTMMTLLPETSRLKDGMSYVEYVQKLATTLDRNILLQFGIFLEEAQVYYDQGYPSSKIAGKVCSREVIRGCLNAALSTPDERIQLCREVRKELKKKNKAAGIEKQKARRMIDSAKAAVEHSRQLAETAEGKHLENALRQLAEDEANLARTETHFQKIIDDAQTTQRRCRQDLAELNRSNNPMVALRIDGYKPLPLNFASSLDSTIADIAAMLNDNRHSR